MIKMKPNYAGSSVVLNHKDEHAAFFNDLGKAKTLQR